GGQPGGRTAVEAAARSEHPQPEGPEPGAEQNADVARPALTAPRVTVSSGSSAIGARPLNDGAATRPQPQHLPRSQRKK
ncbi:MAG: hypothetical protein ACLGIF_01285, partial [Actinomycetes bacterium]